MSPSKSRFLVGERSESKRGPDRKCATSFDQARGVDRLSARHHYSWQKRNQSTAVPPHFLGSRGQDFIKCPGDTKQSADDESHDTARLISANESARTRINAMALREIDVEIAARESELATMKRARAVLERDRCGTHESVANVGQG
jgi:hypothetical protein